MDTTEQTRSRKSGGAYPKRHPFYDSEEGMTLLRDLARRRGVNVSALIRTLVREEADRVGLTMDAEAAVASSQRPIWEVIDELVKETPEADRATLPTDLAAQHDHYLYGSPKR